MVPVVRLASRQAGDWDPDQAETLAARETDDLLPAGPQTAGMLLLAAENGNGEEVGRVWIALNRSRPGYAWIYDIEIDPGHHGKGYGRGLLGGATLAAEAAALGLIDEYRAKVYPVPVGGGVPFFRQHKRRADLELAETRTFSSSVVYLRYRVAR